MQELMKMNPDVMLLATLVLAAPLQLPAAMAPPRPVPAGDFPAAEGPYKPTWQSLAQGFQIPQWFREAKFGIWSHWSPQVEPEQGDWYALRMYQPKSPCYKWHVEHYGHPSVFGYKDLLPLFKAEKFDPEAQMALFKRAGARYFVALASHHDNVDCWDSSYQPWNTVNIGPKKDLVGLWREAALKAGLRFGISVHSERAWSWWGPAHGSDTKGPQKGVPYDANLTKADGKGKWWEGLDPVDLYCEPCVRGGRPSERFIRQWTNRTREMVSKYQPDLLYFDSRSDRFDKELAPQGMEMLAHYFNVNYRQHGGKLEAVVNVKGMPAGFENPPLVWDLERVMPADIKVLPYQNDTSVGDWHFRVGQEYRETAWYLRSLVENVSKNGNLLLAVPQRADGSLDEGQVKVLEEFAKWMEIGGEAIFGTHAWRKFGEGPAVWAGSEALSRKGRRDSFTEQDFRFTAKGNTVYAFLMAWPTGGNSVIIRSLCEGSEPVTITKVEMLGVQSPLSWKRTNDGLSIQLPPAKPCDYIYPIRITWAPGQ